MDLRRGGEFPLIRFFSLRPLLDVDEVCGVYIAPVYRRGRNQMGIPANLNHASSQEVVSIENVNRLSKELVIGLVGYAGAGCSLVGEKLWAQLDGAGYKVEYIKLSSLIVSHMRDGNLPPVEEGPGSGVSKLARAIALQDAGDDLRSRHQSYAVAALVVKEIKKRRGSNLHGEGRVAFILDSIKHYGEVDLLRRVYDRSFRLISVHCERATREARLIGRRDSTAKYKGASECDVRAYMDRDEGDSGKKHGQQVREAFYLGDFFIDNNGKSPDGVRLNSGITRFLNLILGRELVRPTAQEVGMFHAYAASLQSSCLSRQVGSALQTMDGRIVATGTNEVPKFGGGVYSEGDKRDERCHKFSFQIDAESGGEIAVFRGCHNDRRKKSLRHEIAKWLRERFAPKLAKSLNAERGLLKADSLAKNTEKTAKKISDCIVENENMFDDLPGVKDIIEYSRAIHAEMTAVFAAARQGIPTIGSRLYCTTFPCHNCARHLVVAGVTHVYYIEPYVKSLASELHGDSILTTPPIDTSTGQPIEEGVDRMLILPFTGVGPRMYEDHFAKRSELKVRGSGEYKEPNGEFPAIAARISELAHVEELAAGLVPDS